MIDKSELKKAIGKILVDSGFSKKAANWYRSSADAIIVVNLQKSDFGEYFYLNFGVLLKCISQESFPKVEACHISMRADGLIDMAAQGGDKGFNLEQGNSSDLESTLLVLREELIPLMVDFLSIENLKKHYAKGAFKRALIFWQAREILET